jgi:hypothetical protein
MSLSSNLHCPMQGVMILLLLPINIRSIFHSEKLTIAKNYHLFIFIPVPNQDTYFSVLERYQFKAVLCNKGRSLITKHLRRSDFAQALLRWV